jgi:hypothetical protein
VVPWGFVNQGALYKHHILWDVNRVSEQESELVGITV